MRPSRRPPARPLAAPYLTMVAASGGASLEGYSSEALSLFGRFTTPPTSARKALINNFINSLLLGPTSRTNIWVKQDFMHVMAAADAQAAQQNWVANQYNLTLGSTPTFTADRGYAGNNTDAYLDTNATANALAKYSQDSASIGVWIRTSDAATQTAFGTQPSGFIIRGHTNAGATERLTRVNTSTSLTADDNLTTGFLVGVRRDSANQYSYRNGGNEATGLAASAAPSAETITYLRSATFYAGTGTQASIGFAGSQLSAAEILDYYNAGNAYLTGVGAV